MTFKRWNIVIAKINKDPSIEAVVDFETKEWKVYISEWWRQLSYPTRLIVDANKLFLKDKKIKIWRQRMQDLIRECLWEDLDYLNLKTLDTLKPWDIFRFKWYDYIYMQKYVNDYIVVWRMDYNGATKKDDIKTIFWLTRSEVEESMRTKEDIVQKIFWTNVKVNDVVIVDDETWEEI